MTFVQALNSAVEVAFSFVDLEVCHIPRQVLGLDGLLWAGHQQNEESTLFDLCWDQAGAMAFWD